MKKLTLVCLLGLGTLEAEEIDVLKARLVTPKVIERFHGEIGLSEDQKSRLTELRDAAAVEAQAMAVEVSAAYRTAEATLAKAGVEEEAAAAVLETLLEKEAALKHGQLRFLLGIRAELTAEQVEKAMALAAVPQPEREALEKRVAEKAGRLKAAFENLGVEPPASLKEKGKTVEDLIKDGRFVEAEAELDALVAKTKLNELKNTPVPTFQTQLPGAIDVESLKSRYLEVQAKVKEVTSLPLLNQLLDARDELEDARAQEDLERLGRVLTWAEEALGN